MKGYIVIVAVVIIITYGINEITITAARRWRRSRGRHGLLFKAIKIEPVSIRLNFIFHFFPPLCRPSARVYYIIITFPCADAHAAVPHKAGRRKRGRKKYTPTTNNNNNKNNNVEPVRITNRHVRAHTTAVYKHRKVTDHIIGYSPSSVQVHVNLSSSASISETIGGEKKIILHVCSAITYTMYLLYVIGVRLYINKSALKE